MVGLLVLVALVWAITHFYLRGEDLSAYDSPVPRAFSEAAPSAGHLEAVKSLGNMGQLRQKGSGKGRLETIRGYLDAMGEDVAFDGEIIPVDSAGISGEWLIPPGCDTTCRTLYIHGGAFMMGSPLSHRAITSKYAEITGGAVLSLDYRLMPENRRSAGIEDCRSAYRWLLENGPSGKQPAATVYVSGDSAGGNLALSLSAWVRDQGLRAPDAVVALSPATDGTMASPSLRANLNSDPMLGPAFGKLIKVPGWVLLWVALFTGRTTPARPDLSPALGDLGGLPPTLVHASLAEMLCDDAVRYVNKARASGSPVTLQTWSHMVHVWHIFQRDMPEAQQAFAEIDSFLKQHRQAVVAQAAA